MATLKDHQQAMVDLLANGSGIPASASRLAHAMHDVLGVMLCNSSSLADEMSANILRRLSDATTPGLNDKALAGDLEACRPKATPAERRVKELENTVKQLRASNAVLRAERDELRAELDFVDVPERAGCRKPDTQVECGCTGPASYCADGLTLLCDQCGKDITE